jgi:DNA-binding NarL/FixJ family response regulator
MTKNSSRPWTEGEDQKLLELLAQGKSERSVALTLRRTSNAVSSRLYILRTKAKRNAVAAEADDA